MEWVSRTAWPLRTRSQRCTSTIGFSGVEVVNDPFIVLPRSGERNARCGSRKGSPAAAHGTAASNDTRSARFLFVIIDSVLIRLTPPNLPEKTGLYWKNFTDDFSVAQSWGRRPGDDPNTKRGSCRRTE